MPRKLSKNFFIQNGRILNPLSEQRVSSLAFPREAISTLSNAKPTKKDLIFKKILLVKEQAKVLTSKQYLATNARWASASLAITLLLATFIFRVPVYKYAHAAPEKYSVFSSIPLTLDTVSQELDYSDSRAVRIDRVMELFNCPMAGLGDTFVKKADENNIPYWVTAAIAFQESSCGKNTPKADGVDSYNAWGWATYGDSIYKFDDYEQGIDVVSKYLAKKFYSVGTTDLCEIMKTYTPPSNGSWCKGVGYFGDFIQSYKSPQGI